MGALRPHGVNLFIRQPQGTNGLVRYPKGINGVYVGLKVGVDWLVHLPQDAKWLEGWHQDAQNVQENAYRDANFFFSFSLMFI